MKERQTHTDSVRASERASERASVVEGFAVERERERFVLFFFVFRVFRGTNILVSFSLQMVFFCILEP